MTSNKPVEQREKPACIFSIHFENSAVAKSRKDGKFFSHLEVISHVLHIRLPEIAKFRVAKYSYIVTKYYSFHLATTCIKSIGYQTRQLFYIQTSLLYLTSSISRKRIHGLIFQNEINDSYHTSFNSSKNSFAEYEYTTNK